MWPPSKRCQNCNHWAELTDLPGIGQCPVSSQEELRKYQLLTYNPEFGIRKGVEVEFSMRCNLWAGTVEAQEERKKKEEE